MPDRMDSSTIIYFGKIGDSEGLKAYCNQPNKNISCSNLDGDTALHLACRNGHTSFVKSLLELGINPALRNNFGDTAVHLASRHGHQPIVKLLLQIGLDWKLLNHDGHTAYDLSRDDDIRLLFCIYRFPSVYHSEDNATVRYIRFDAPATFLQISQVAVYSAIDGTNLALNKKCYASSTNGNVPAGIAVDGVLKPRDYPRMFHSANSSGDYWYVDLGAEHRVDKIVYYNRSVCSEWCFGNVITALDASNTINYIWHISSRDLVQEFSTKVLGAFQSPVSSQEVTNLLQSIIHDSSSGGNVTNTIADLKALLTASELSTHLKAHAIPVNYHNEVILKVKKELARQLCPKLFGSESGHNVRYVRIDAPKTILQISQVAVYSAADGSNLALKKTTFASRPGASKDHAANAVDGQLKHRLIFYHGSKSSGDYWYVDLGAEHKVDKIVYYNRSDCNDRAISYVITALDASNTVKYTWEIKSADLVQEFTTRYKNALVLCEDPSTSAVELDGLMEAIQLLDKDKAAEAVVRLRVMGKKFPLVAKLYSTPALAPQAAVMQGFVVDPKVVCTNSAEELHLILLKHSMEKNLDRIVSLLLPMVNECVILHSKGTTHLWCDIVSDPSLVVYDVEIFEVLRVLKKSIRDICYCENSVGRKAVDGARGRVREEMLKLLIFFRLYELKEGSAEHESATCIVRLARDWSSEGNGRPVALKFMKNLDQFQREITVRAGGSFDSSFVIGILRTHNSDEDSEFQAATEEYRLYPYCIVMMAADRSLKSIIDHENVAGRDWRLIQKYTMQLAVALGHIHQRGFIHGDVKPFNVMRLDGKLTCIDLDASVGIGSYAGAKYSLAHVPPEFLAVSDKGEITLRAHLSDTALDPSSKDVGYEPLVAHFSFDIWGLGVSLFQLFTDETLFHATGDGSLDAQSLRLLADWADDYKRSRLVKVKNVFARLLLGRLLSKDPLKRPSIEAILKHPFFDANGGPAGHYDVFISYRVASEAAAAEVLYRKLTALGVKVYLDKYCLEPGLLWEDGFCAGLINSDIFLPLLSREAINSSSKDRQNFSRLHPDSSCDNVFLEQRLALELMMMGILQRIFPVLIGDRVGESDDGPIDALTFSNYFGSACHPTTTDVVVLSVEEKLREHLDKQGLGQPCWTEGPVNKVLGKLMSFQGLLFEGRGETAVNKVCQAVQHMVLSQNEGTYSCVEAVVSGVESVSAEEGAGDVAEVDNALYEIERLRAALAQSQVEWLVMGGYIGYCSAV